MRTIDDHKVNPANDTIKIEVVDEPGAGGANHTYFVTGIEFHRNQGHQIALDHARSQDQEGQAIIFQNGPISADGNGVNGLTHEVLLAIVADRLRSFQSGPYACKANSCALTHIEEAQHWLQQRTIERMRRGVEGTHTV